MKIVAINSMVFGSTGRIMSEAANIAKNRGHQVMMFSPMSRTNKKLMALDQTLFGCLLLKVLGEKLSFYTGYSNCFCFLNTYILIRKIDSLHPDIIHLHNLHPDYINIPLLFRYIKRNHIPVVWTLHDCWAFTGGCPHFILAKCNQWKTGCTSCSQYRQYPGSFFDNTRKMYSLKKKWFGGVENMTIVTPSYWLAEQVGESFLKSYKTIVIPNGINTELFQRKDSRIREKYDCVGKKIVLGVAYSWGFKKGLDVFIKLSEILLPCYQIVLVGIDEKIKSTLSTKIISIARTESQIELCELYSAADVFVNPTREEVLGMVNIEALACGTPVVTFNTGGSPECIDDTCGVVVPVDDITAMKNAIIDVCEKKTYTKEACRNRIKDFSKEVAYNSYVNLYESLCR